MMPPIAFTNSNFQGVDLEQDDHMVITIEMENFAVKKIPVDRGGFVDIHYRKTYKKLQLLEDAMIPYDEPVSQPESLRDGEPKKKTSFKKRYGVATIVILENYGKP